ncbi:Asp-tRNA(Asn)/Glu-tRNA(Gln) amidotransferase subunit GatA (plasmid) [Aminobacter sp. SR38]|jgi:aspartyl-tRNA(Asn)/glutamyl-tRNA(Gln) amidotransferase subunit A|uniref:amidase n=1 Tax=Aminobacter sp. SR38 TaxID=2774562 RepID=UPI0017856BE7|nr:amidase [Aminobacter sp. SR38]QOF75488.1 Asp-tRNA(Asn)/Glu-tRNA(Gln) amidotransferase subunit GatA [Aminobacter sp. SR38]
MSDLTSLEVHELAALLVQGETSPVEITAAFLNRIGSVNPLLNAFVSMDEERALSEARQAEAEIAEGRYKGALHGIPIAHKDLYATSGMLTTGGSKLLEGNTPDEDATVVAALKAAGMVTLGKTNTHEFAYGPTNENSLFGPVRNPWNTSRISGGSSGGSAAAVAAGLAPIASGTDTGGSIRIPAACCSLTGLKPTYGRISRSGILPLCWTMDHPGPLARSARDAALFLQATAGFDHTDAASSQARVPDNYLAMMTGDVSKLKIGVVRNYFFDGTQEHVAALAEDALGVLAALGAEVVDIQVPHMEMSAAAALAIYLAEATAYHDDWLGDRADEYTEQVRTFLELGNHLLAKDYLHAQRFRTLLGHSIAKAFESVDVIATPAVAMTATPIGEPKVTIRGQDEAVFGALLRNTEPFNLTGLPAVVVPCGFDCEGMPSGLQLVGPAFAEERILNAAHGYQLATDWHRRRPQN